MDAADASHTFCGSSRTFCESSSSHFSHIESLIALSLVMDSAVGTIIFCNVSSDIMLSVDFLWTSSSPLSRFSVTDSDNIEEAMPGSSDAEGLSDKIDCF